MNQKEVGPESTLSVVEYQLKKAKKSSSNVYVKNFPLDVTEEDLRCLFSNYGEIQNVCIMKDEVGKSKGFGFVSFTEASGAERAITESAKAAEIDFRFTNLYVREAKSKAERDQELMLSNFNYKKSIIYFSLFVKNFPPGTTEEELKIYFESGCQGQVTKVNIITGTQQAFINFVNQDECRLAKEFAKKVLFKSQYKLFVDFCFPKEIRRIRNEALADAKVQE